MKQKLVKIKEILVHYINSLEYDIENVDYIIDIVDYLLQGSIICSKENIELLIQEVFITSSYHDSIELENVLDILTSIIKEDLCIL